jgi:hypothetical protein
MNMFAVLVMIGWIPAVLLIFSRMSAPRAMMLSFIVAWLFLPQVAFVFPGIPDYTKMSATCYGILLATFIFDAQRFRYFRVSWVDIPIAVFCVAPLFSSLANGLGLYDGLSNVLSQLVTWALPYFLGRLYLNTLESLREIAILIVGGGLIYVPLCLLESRLSPQLHRWVYGFHAHQFVQTIRLDGFRPTVFMQHGLMVAMWMMTSTLLLIWLWQTHVLPKTLQWRGSSVQLRTLWLVILMLGTFVLMRSTGAYLLMGLSLLILWMARSFRTLLPLLLTIVLMHGYLGLSASGYLSSSQRQQVTQAVTQMVGQERAGSLAFRLSNEELLGNRARKSLIFGWGGWGRSRIFDEYGKDVSVTDSLWIITFGSMGLVGLISMMATLLLPVVIFCYRFSPTTWSLVQVAPAAGIATILLMYALDCLLNAVVNPIFILLGGGLSSLVVYHQVEHLQTTNQQLQPQKRTFLGRKLRQRPAPRNFL